MNEAVGCCVFVYVQFLDWERCVHVKRDENWIRNMRLSNIVSSVHAF